MKLRAKIQAEVGLQAMTLQLEDKRDVLCFEPTRRKVQYTIVTRRGPEPDPDNAIAGIKLLQDCLLRRTHKRVKLRKPVHGQKYAMEYRENGPGFLWDDSPEFLEILPVKFERDTQIYPEGTRYVVVEIFPGDVLANDVP